MENNTMHILSTGVLDTVQSELRRGPRLGSSEAGMVIRHMCMLPNTDSISALEHRYNTTHITPLRHLWTMVAMETHHRSCRHVCMKESLLSYNQILYLTANFTITA